MNSQRRAIHAIVASVTVLSIVNAAAGADDLQTKIVFNTPKSYRMQVTMSQVGQPTATIEGQVGPKVISLKQNLAVVVEEDRWVNSRLYSRQNGGAWVESSDDGAFVRLSSLLYPSPSSFDTSHGYRVERLADATVAGTPCHVVRIAAPPSNDVTMRPFDVLTLWIGAGDGYVRRVVSDKKKLLGQERDTTEYSAFDEPVVVTAPE